MPDSLPGFDLAAATARLSGNRGLHAELLLQFATEHADCIAAVERSLDARHPSEAVATLHRMKGAAVIVGARELADLAAAAEDEVLHGRRPSLQPLHDAMAGALDNIRTQVVPRTSAGDDLAPPALRAVRGHGRGR